DSIFDFSISVNLGAFYTYSSCPAFGEKRILLHPAANINMKGNPRKKDVISNILNISIFRSKIIVL
ncbi:MAG: hypothetical protein JXR78_14990, partial [Victivallales bacterium]|nr:hypothetical protein [Victivallales bacterium]